MAWVLKDRRLYFRNWSGIGPRSTPDLCEAARFTTKEEAMRSPAYSFSLTSYNPVEVKR